MNDDVPPVTDKAIIPVLSCIQTGLVTVAFNTSTVGSVTVDVTVCVQPFASFTVNV